MSMVTWSFLDLHPSYSGRSTSPRRAVSVAQGRDALEELDPREEGDDGAWRWSAYPIRDGADRGGVAAGRLRLE